MKPNKLLAASDVAELLIGIQDCIFGLGVALVNRGVITREEIAGVFEDILEQQKARPDAQHPSRQLPVEGLAKAFRMPVYDVLD
jgi:hypothetical protein